MFSMSMFSGALESQLGVRKMFSSDEDDHKQLKSGETENIQELLRFF